MRAEGPKPEALDGEAEEEDIWMDSPPADQQQRFTNSPPEEEAILQEWCSQDHVSLPTWLSLLSRFTSEPGYLEPAQLLSLALGFESSQ